MDIKSLAAGMLMKKLGGDSGAIGGVLESLVGSGDSMDLGSLVSGLKDKGLGDVASSWIGEGENKAISADQLKDVLGSDKVSEAAAKLGTDEGSLLDSLKDAIPQVVDQASSGGSLLDSLGGVSGLAKKFL